ncbi:hypothetical protein MPSEU_000216200 [Mayamaea pseudoterrestris]|nr:hypothetical protein MPSEU_000216200 [Mayamaea pseudoterrestris]
MANIEAINSENATISRKRSQLEEKCLERVATDEFVRLNVFGDHERAVSSVKFAPSRLCQGSSVMVASASASSSIKIWNLSQDVVLEETLDDTHRKALTPTTQCRGHARGVNEVCWNPYAALLASASDDKTVRIWDIATGESLSELKGHENFVFCVDQQQTMVVSGSFDETVKLWDLRTGDCVCTLPAHSEPVTSVSFNRDGTCVCTASHDGLIRLWDVATGECLKTIFAAGNPPVCSAKFSPNGKFLLAGTLDSVIRLWPVTTTSKSQSCSKSYSSFEHIHTKYSVVSDFIPGYHGNIVTGSENGSVVIYDIQSKQVRQVLKGHKDSVLAVSAHDKLSLLASGGMMADRKVEFWKLRTSSGDRRDADGGDTDMANTENDASLEAAASDSNKKHKGEEL